MSKTVHLVLPVVFFELLDRFHEFRASLAENGDVSSSKLLYNVLAPFFIAEIVLLLSLNSCSE